MNIEVRRESLLEVCPPLAIREPSIGSHEPPHPLRDGEKLIPVTDAVVAEVHVVHGDPAGPKHPVSRAREVRHAGDVFAHGLRHHQIERAHGQAVHVLDGSGYAPGASWEVGDIAGPVFAHQGVPRSRCGAVVIAGESVQHGVAARPCGQQDKPCGEVIAGAYLAHISSGNAGGNVRIVIDDAEGEPAQVVGCRGKACAAGPCASARHGRDAHQQIGGDLSGAADSDAHRRSVRHDKPASHLTTQLCVQGKY